MTSAKARIAQGVPTGGQFARSAQAASDLELTGPSADLDEDYGCEPGCDHEAKMENAHQATLFAESLSSDLSAKLGMPVQITKPEPDAYVHGRFNAAVESGDVWTPVEFEIGETERTELVAELAAKFTEDPVFRKNQKAAAKGASKPATPDKAPLFTEPAADINAFDPAARAALIASLQPKQLDRSGGYTTVVGAKYAGHQSAADVAKQVRADLKAAQAAMALPDGVTYAVRSDSFAGGQAIRITAMGLPDSALSEPDTGGMSMPHRTAESAELDQTLMAIGQAYDRAQSGTDLHNPTYFCSTTLESEHSREYREFEKAQRSISSASRASNFADLAARHGELTAARDAYTAARRS